MIELITALWNSKELSAYIEEHDVKQLSNNNIINFRNEDQNDN